MTLLWAKFIAWCKERWELIVGFFLGIFALLALFRRGDKKLIQKKTTMNDELLEAETQAKEKLEKEYQENLQTFLSRNEKIEAAEKQKILALDGTKKERVKELLSSEDPEAAVATALAELLK